MKKTKILANLLVLIVLISTITATLASADDVSTVSTSANLIVENTISSTGITLKDKTYNLYQVFSAVVTETATEDDEEAIEYTVNVNFVEFFEQQTGVSYPDSDDYDSETGFNEDGVSYDNAVAAFNYAATEYVNTFSSKLEGTTETEEALVSLLREYIIEQDLAATQTTAHYTLSGNDYETLTAVDVELGYYVIFDSLAISGEVGETDAVTNGSLATIPGRGSDGEIDNDVTIQLKGSAPQIDKDIWHNDIANANGDNSPASGTSGSWDDVADYEIGDTVEFRLTVDIPSDVSAYTDYVYTITDTLSDGLSFNNDITIYTDAALNNSVTGNLHTISYPSSEDDFTFQLSLDIMGIKNSDPTVEVLYIYYTADVTEDANLYTDYEQNEVELVFSNNPYDDESFGKDSDIVYGYTFEIDVFKTKGDGITALEDAKFALYEVIVSTDGTTHYEQIYLAQDTEDALEVPTYYPSVGTASDIAGIIITDENGKFNIVGLDDAKTYALVEIEAPAGYNIADPVLFKIQADYTTTTTGIPTPTLTVTGNTTSLDITVINTSASLLPETGGIGTTVFMVAGGSMMVVALALLVIRRKRAN